MDVLKLLTAEDVQTLFPTSAKENVNTGWPMVAAVLRAGGLSEDPIVIA